MTSNTLKWSTRPAIDPVRAGEMGSAELRNTFLLGDLFVPGLLVLHHVQYDRMIIGGAVPDKVALKLDAIPPTGTPGFLDRREMIVANVGEAEGVVQIGNQSHSLGKHDMLYIGRGQSDVSFKAVSENAPPPRFYLVSAPAHATYPDRKIAITDALRMDLGSAETMNERSIFRFVHPEGAQTCQLVMGLTRLAKGSGWNTMPPHVHDRRSEAYLYVDLEPGARVFHLMGEPTETRHLIVANEEAVLSPPWSIHAGSGTTSYSFIWAMAGENVDYTDVDPVSLGAMR